MNECGLALLIRQVLGAITISAAITAIAVWALKPESLQKYASWQLRPSLDAFSDLRTEDEPSDTAVESVEELPFECSYNPFNVSHQAASCEHATHLLTEDLILAEPWNGWSDIKSCRLFQPFLVLILEVGRAPPEAVIEWTCLLEPCQRSRPTVMHAGGASAFKVRDVSGYVRDGELFRITRVLGLLWIDFVGSDDLLSLCQYKRWKFQ